MLTLLGLFIFALAEGVYSYFASAGCTNWSIFYFSLVYLSMMLISIDVTYRENSQSMQLTSISFSVFFLILMIMELSFINVPFDKYIINVNDNKIRILILGLLSISLIYITATAWEKRRLKR